MQAGWGTIDSDPKAMVLRLECASESHGGLIKTRLVGPAPEFLTQKIWVRP